MGSGTGTLSLSATDAGDIAQAGIGSQLGRYTIRGWLGRGGMGEVFRAHDPELDRPIALKVIRGAGMRARIRFQRESQALARLSHPNVVAVHDVGIADDRMFIAMELVEGVTLSAWLAAQPRTTAEILAVFLQAGRGLAAAHAAGITHRDFKPSNVMVGERVRVVDFGLARLGAPDDEVLFASCNETGEEPSSTSVLAHGVTAVGRAPGTPAYMAPEQRDGSGWSPRADQYAFALALRAALEHPPRRVQRVLVRALRERAEQRYPAMEVLLAQLVPRPRRHAVAGVVLGALVALACGVLGAVARAAAPWRPSTSECHRSIAPALARDDLANIVPLRDASPFEPRTDAIELDDWQAARRSR